VALINSQDISHYACTTFYENNRDNIILVIPSIAYFEFQATQSRLRRENKGAIREIYIENLELYTITKETIKKAANLNIFDKFNNLKGADLIYACIAKIENIPLVTNDKHFQKVQNEIEVIWIGDDYSLEQIHFKFIK
jgi:predicted nucleic acid-binding protein